MGPQLLITGFGPFAGVDHNPSGELAKHLGQRADCWGCELPVTFRGAPEELERQLADFPETVIGILCLGVHPGPGFRLEQRARGTFGGDRPDNEGVTAGDLDLGGPDRNTILDLGALGAALRGAGAQEVSLSRDAGAFVCEATYRCALRAGAARRIPALFLHVPPSEELSVRRQGGIVTALVEEFLRQAQS